MYNYDLVNQRKNQKKRKKKLNEKKKINKFNDLMVYVGTILDSCKSYIKSGCASKKRKKKLNEKKKNQFNDLMVYMGTILDSCKSYFKCGCASSPLQVKSGRCCNFLLTMRLTLWLEVNCFKYK